jgi:ATP-binding protein involved in chromosome partitioning
MSEKLFEAIGAIKDPELRQSFAKLKMVESCTLVKGKLAVQIKLTIAGCPMKDEIQNLISEVAKNFTEVKEIEVTFSVMTKEEREEVKKILRGGKEKVITFAKPESTTRVIGIASGKGGVGKSSITANLAVTLQKLGFAVGVLDADIYGHSIPRLLNVVDQHPTNIDQFFIPLESQGVKVVSIEMFKESRLDPIAYRGPLLHRVLEQLLADAYWGDLDFLLIDLPPGTGDIAISLGQLIPNSEVLVVTTPQLAASEVAERAGRLAIQMNQKIIGVVENYSYLVCEQCKAKQFIFGQGGGERTAEILSQLTKSEVPLLVKIPFGEELRSGGDVGAPIALSIETANENTPQDEATAALLELAKKLTIRSTSLVGRSLPLTLN